MKTAKPSSPALKKALAKAPPKLVDELASRVISEGICGKRELQILALPLAISSENTAARHAARSVLARSGFESTSALFQELVEEGKLGLDALPIFVDMAVQLKSMEKPGHVDPKAIIATLSIQAKSDFITSASDSEAGLALIGRSAIRMSLQFTDQGEKEFSKEVLTAIGLETIPRLFQEMVQSRELELESLWPFLRIVLDIKSEESIMPIAQPPEAKAPPELPVQKAEHSETQAGPSSAEAAAPIEDAPKKPPAPHKAARPKKPKSKKEAKQKVAETKKPPLDAGMEPAELRNADLKLFKIDKRAMYRLICLECFRLCTAKPLIGKSYAPIKTLQGNLQRRLNGDPQLKRMFDQCWKRMVAKGAILLAKSNTVASLTSQARTIADRDIREALEWALENHRKLTTG